MLFVLKLVVSVAVLAAVFYRVPVSEAFAVIGQVPVAAVLGVIALYYMDHGINAVKLRILLPHLSFVQALRFTLIGILYGAVLPGQLAGDAVKALRIARTPDHAGTAAVIAAVTLDKLTSFIALLLLTIAGLIWEVDLFGTSVVTAAVAAIVILGIALAVLLTAPLPHRMGTWVHRVMEWRKVALRPHVILPAILLSLVFHSVSIIILSILGAALGIDLAVTAWAVVLALIALVLILPITVAGIGVRDGSLVAVLGMLGHSEAAALGLSLLLLGLTLLGAFAGFIADMLGRDREKKSAEVTPSSLP